MAKILCLSGSCAVNAVAAGATEYLPCPLGIGTPVKGVTTEAKAQVTARTAGTLSNVAVRVTANDRTGAGAAKIRINGADGNLAASIPAGTTGEFEDTAHTDSVSAGDEVNYSVTSGSGGSTFTHSNLSCLFEPASGTVIRLVGFRDGVFNAASTSTYVLPVGTCNTLSSWENRSFQFRAGGTLRNLFVYVSANARTTTTTFRSYINGANGNLLCSVGSGATGIFEDLTNTDSIGVGDRLSYAVVTGSGTENLTCEGLAAEWSSSESKFVFVAGGDVVQSLALNTTYYWPLAGDQGNLTTESTVRAGANTTFTGSQLTVRAGANQVDNTSYVRFRKNGADGNQSVAITGDTTGWFTDTTGTDSVAASDGINMAVVVGNSASGILQIASVSMLASVSGGTSRDLLASIVGPTINPGISATSARAVVAAIGAGSISGDISATQLRDIVTAMSGASTAPDIQAATFRALQSTIAGASLTYDAAVMISRALVAAVAGQSSLTDITATIQGLTNLVASLTGISATADIQATIARRIAADIAGSSFAPDLWVMILRNFAATMTGSSATPDITAILGNVLELAAAVTGVGLTPDVAISLARSLSALIAAASLTGDVSVNTARSLSTSIPAESICPEIMIATARMLLADIHSSGLTPDDLVLLLRGLGVILDPTIESLTAVRALLSLTPRRTIESL